MLYYKMEVTNMRIPKDPVILLSFINTQLRDNYSTLDALCDHMEIDKKELVEKLRKINYEYNSDLNKFC